MTPESPSISTAAANIIEGRLRRSFEGTEVRRFVDVDPLDEHFQKAAQEALKHLGRWIDENDFQEICTGCVFDLVPRPVDATPRLVTGEEARTAATAVVRFLESLPRKYVVSIPVPRLAVPTGEIILSPSIRLVRTAEGAANSLRRMMAPGRTASCTYVVIESEGYARFHLRQSGVHAAIFLVKRVIAAAMTKRLIRSRPYWHDVGIIGFARSEPLPKEVLLGDVEGGWPKWAMELPASIATFLGSLVLTIDDGPNSESTAPRIRSDHIVDDVRAALSPIAELVSLPAALGNTAALRSAFEWAFDADSDDEPLVSFIKTCISLEAVLGEGSDDEGITKRLSDRCAYLLNSTPEARKATRGEMRKIYEFRSKVVHGTKLLLSNEDHNLLMMARFYRNMVLVAELGAIEKWWLTLSRAATH